MFLYQYQVTIRCGFPDDQPAKVNVPENLKKARKLWKANQLQALSGTAHCNAQYRQDIYKLILPFLKVSFIRDLLKEVDLVGFKQEDICAKSVKIHGVTFGRGALPTIYATATFDMLLKESFSTPRAFINWQKQHDFLYWGVVFEYVLNEIGPYFYALFDLDALHAKLVLPGIEQPVSYWSTLDSSAYANTQSILRHRLSHT